MNNCTHKIETSRYVEIEDDWNGGTYWEWQYDTKYTTEDIGVGAYRCTQCGEVMYYTGSWKKFYTEGVPCPSSEYSERTGDVHKVRAAIKEQK